MLVLEIKEDSLFIKALKSNAIKESKACWRASNTEPVRQSTPGDTVLLKE